MDQRDGSLHTLTDVGIYTSKHLRLNRRQLRKHRSMLIELKQKSQQLQSALLTPGLPPAWVTRVREVLDAIDREFLNPQPPYEVPDLLP